MDLCWMTEQFKTKTSFEQLPFEAARDFLSISITVPVEFIDTGVTRESICRFHPRYRYLGELMAFPPHSLMESDNSLYEMKILRSRREMLLLFGMCHDDYENLWRIMRN